MNYKERYDSLNVFLDKLLQLPTKYIDTRFVLILQFIFCVSIFSLTAIAQLTLVNRCIVPVPSSFLIK